METGDQRKDFYKQNRFTPLSFQQTNVFNSSATY